MEPSPSSKTDVPTPSISISGPSRPSFQPTIQPANHQSSLTTPTESWIEPLSAPCHFSLSTFLSVLKDLCLHPERNSSLILRADPLPPRDIDDGPIEGLERMEVIRVRLMPKQPKRDGRIDQRCMSYRTRETGHERGKEEGLVLMIPEVKEVVEIPFYHPPVRKLAFRYETIPIPPDESATVDECTSSEEPPVKGRISIAYLPFDTPPPPTDEHLEIPTLPSRPARGPRNRSPLAGPPLGQGEDTAGRTPPPAVILASDGSMPEDEAAKRDTAVTEERLHRTCLGLLERVYKHGYGRMVGYRKRVKHDVIVSRDSFQDLYLILKDRHRHLDSRAPKPGSSKIEDVKRHVFKDTGLPSDPSLPDNLAEWGSQDVAVAAFLMLLWREMCPAPKVVDEEDGEKRDWDSWGRPRGGFIDLGCGNGLLVHILIAEGYDGKGYELRARRTWPSYPPSTRQALIEMPIELPTWFPQSIEDWDDGDWEGREACPIKEGTFLIGNHADEITPWIPFLSLLPTTPVPHLSLPCCMHTLDSSFDQLNFTPPTHPHAPSGGFEEGLEPGQSRYKAYLMWLGWYGLQCGWEWEKEGLRVPSTRGWGIVARKRWTMTSEEDRVCRGWVLERVNEVRARGIFNVREKEGKEHGKKHY